MEREALIEKRVHDYYWEDDLNCATTTLKTLSEICGIKLEQQVIDSAVGMHGAGKFGAQCGLVEGTLLFIGIFCRSKGFDDKKTVKACYDFAWEFQHAFGSLVCRELRVEGFKKENPPHLCEMLTKKAMVFAADYLENVLLNQKN